MGVRNGPIVRERDASRTKELTRVLLCCLAFSVPVFFYVWEQVTHYQIGQEIQTMERERAKLLEEGRKLDLERSRLTALGRVESIARRELGFVDGAPVEMLALGGRGLPAAPVEVLASAATPPSAVAGVPDDGARDGGVHDGRAADGPAAVRE